MPIDKKISELPIATSIGASDVSVLVDAGTDYQYTFTLLLQFLEANLATGAKVLFGTVLPQNTTGRNGDVFVNTSAGTFAQKVAGTWTIVYTLPAVSAADGTLLYGAGIPGTATGKNSDSYINTLTGIFYQKIAGAWSQVFSMATGPQGPQGIAGTNGANGTSGNTILFGSGDPSNSVTGVNGNFYINTTTYKIFGPKTAGIWGNGLSIIGAGIPGGGAAGQILAKADSSDFNTIWEDNSFVNISGQPADNTRLAAALSGKIDKMTGFGLSSNDYTGAEKTKLASLTKHYQGKYSSLSTLQTAIPAASDGDYAIVVGSPNDQEYIWDSDHTSWVLTENIPASTFAALGGNANDNASLSAALNAKENIAGKDALNGYAGLDGSGNFNKTTDNLNEGTSKLYFTAARVLTTILTGIGFSTSMALLATDTVLQAIGKLQAQITAMIKIPAGGTAGQVLSKVDATNGNTQWSTNTLQAVTNNGNGTTKNISAGTIGSPISTLYFIGDSNTTGYGLSDINTRWATVLCNQLRCQEVNNAVSGMTLQNASPAGSGGSILTQLTLVPNYDNANSYLIINLGTNDIDLSGMPSNTYSLSAFTAGLTTLLSNATSKGWPLSRVTFVTPPFIGTYQPAGTTSNTATSVAYNATLIAFANANGCPYFDLFTITTNNGGISLLQSDGLHQNLAGHQLKATAVGSMFSGATIYGDAQVSGELSAGQITGFPTVYNVKRSITATANDYIEIGTINEPAIDIHGNQLCTMRLKVIISTDGSTGTYSPCLMEYDMFPHFWVSNGSWVTVGENVRTGLNGNNVGQTKLQAYYTNTGNGLGYLKLRLVSFGLSWVFNVSIYVYRPANCGFTPLMGTGNDATGYPGYSLNILSDYDSGGVHISGNNITLNNSTMPTGLPSAAGQIISSDASGNWSYINPNGLIAQGDFTAQTVNKTINTFTVGATTAYFRISGYININSVTTNVIQLQVAYTDENNVPRTGIFYSQGTTNPGLSITGNSSFSTMDIRCRNGTIITVSATLTTSNGSINFDCGGRIQQL
jgi:lysophospholipase L1-like esterase